MLAFDFGVKNIGVATGQSLTHSAQALPHLNAKEGIPNWDEIAALVKEWQPKKLVVGLPINMDGSDSELTRRARKFGNRLHARYKIKVIFIDERLSSREAKEVAASEGHKGNYKRAPIDSIAAAVILESYWRSL